MHNDELDFLELEAFFSSAISERAASGLSETACIALTIDERTVFFTRKEGKNHLSNQSTTRPDVQFWLSKNAMRHFVGLAESPHASLAQLGLAILERLFKPNSDQRIKFRVNASFLSLFTKGYFSVLKAGGPEVVSYIARLGFSLSKIKNVLRGIRG